MLNSQQMKAVEYNGPSKNILILAGAGCGKTTVIVKRVINLIQNGTDASEIILLTFTNRASREMKQRLRSEIGDLASDVFSGTFHKLCLEIMSKMPKTFGLNGLNILDQDEQQSLMAKCRSSVIKGYDKDFAKEFPKKAQLIEFKSFSANTCVSVESYLKSQTKYPLDDEHTDLIKECISKYSYNKEKNGYVDFDDLLTKFSDTLKSNEELRDKIAYAFSHVLVDEFQDTNTIQYEILRSITSSGANLFAVGDDAQSIYGWRGANFETTNQFTDHFDSSEVIKLNQNYRSYQEILDLSNWLLGRSHLDYNKKLEAARGSSGNMPIFKSFDDQYEEADYIANGIVDRYNESVPYRDMAIIVPTAFSAKSIEGELARRRIPYVFIGGTALSKSAHIKDVLGMVRIAADPRDELAWFRYLCLFPRIGESTANRLINDIMKNGCESYLETIESKYGAESLLYRVTSVLSDASTPEDVVTRSATSLSPVLSERYDRWSSRSRDLKVLMKMSSKYKDLNEFLHDLVLEPMSSTQIEKDEVKDAVTIITVHSAKGAEFPITFVSCVNPGLYPNSRTYGDLDAEEEQRRVLYVALTRAKDELIVTRTEYQRGGFNPYSKSCSGEEYFFSDIPYEIVDLGESEPKNSSKKRKGLFSLSD